MKTQFFVIIGLMAIIGLMTAATTAIPMLEDGNGHIQTAHAALDSSCGSWYNPACGNWYDPQYD
jgi:hypothetical protein